MTVRQPSVNAGLRPPPSAADGVDRGPPNSRLHLIERRPGGSGQARQFSCQIFCHRRIYADSRRHRHLENLLIRLVFALSSWFEWVPWLGTTLAGATEALNTVETLTISFIVFTFGSLLVAIQVASGRLTPRIIATALLHNNVIRFTVGLFTFSMLFAAGTGARMGAAVPRTSPFR